MSIGIGSTWDEENPCYMEILGLKQQLEESWEEIKSLREEIKDLKSEIRDRESEIRDMDDIIRNF